MLALGLQQVKTKYSQEYHKHMDIYHTRLSLTNEITGFRLPRA